jgi:hypothetical protein
MAPAQALRQKLALIVTLFRLHPLHVHVFESFDDLGLVESQAAKIFLRFREVRFSDPPPNRARVDAIMCGHIFDSPEGNIALTVILCDDRSPEAL